MVRRARAEKPVQEPVSPNLSRRSGQRRRTNSTVSPVTTPVATAAQTNAQLPPTTAARRISAGRVRCMSSTAEGGSGRTWDRSAIKRPGKKEWRKPSNREDSESNPDVVAHARSMAAGCSNLVGVLGETAPIKRGRSTPPLTAGRSPLARSAGFRSPPAPSQRAHRQPFHPSRSEASPPRVPAHQSLFRQLPRAPAPAPA